MQNTNLSISEDGVPLIWAEAAAALTGEGEKLGLYKPDMAWKEPPDQTR